MVQAKKHKSPLEEIITKSSEFYSLGEQKLKDINAGNYQRARSISFALAHSSSVILTPIGGGNQEANPHPILSPPQKEHPRLFPSSKRRIPFPHTLFDYC